MSYRSCLTLCLALLTLSVLPACTASNSSSASPSPSSSQSLPTADSSPVVSPTSPLPSAGGETGTSPEPSPTPTPALQVETALYNGPVEHIFFHPLVAYPKLAFDGDQIAKGFDDWFVTAPEFEAMLKLLYERQYILIDIHSLYKTNTDTSGLPVAVPVTPSLPIGKKPLILSVDDINYYDYMRQNGTITKLIVDQDGTVTSWTGAADGSGSVSRSNELVPILDDFVKEHPDFSWQGAKGILALTGYEGALGYRTNKTDSPGYAEERAGALTVIAALKKSGWTFASHSWGHVNVAKISMGRLKQDTERWGKEIESLTGPTDVFIYPFGSSVKPNDPKIAYLRSQGFDVFASVGPAPYKLFKDGGMFMDRRHIDGVALRTQRAKLEPLFGDAPLLDPAREGKEGSLE